MAIFPTIPEPLAMLARNPFITDFSSDGPIPYVMRQKFSKAPPLPSAETIKGRTVLITGATGGVGYSAASEFIKLGAVLILGVRSISKGNIVRDSLLKEVPEAQITVVELDMANFRSVETFAESVKLATPELDIAIMNAAVCSTERTITSDNHEAMLQVNLLSTAYLSLLLAPQLRSGSRRGRLVVVSSEAHAWVEYSLPKDASILDHLDHSTANFADRYNLTKLLITLWTEAFAQSKEADGVELVMTTPGFCASDLFRESSGLLLAFVHLSSARPVSYGGRTHVHAATAPVPSNGQYFRDGNPTSTSKFCHSAQGAEVRDRLYSEVVSFLRARSVLMTDA